MAVGYNDSLYNGKGGIIARNSWGPDWGNRGYFTIPYDYLTNPNMADDFWAVEIVS